MAQPVSCCSARKRLIVFTVGAGNRHGRRSRLCCASLSDLCASFHVLFRAILTRIAGRRVSLFFFLH